MDRKTSVAQTEAMGLNVNVRRAVAAILTGDATFSTVTARTSRKKQSAVANLIAVCCP